MKYILVITISVFLWGCNNKNSQDYNSVNVVENYPSANNFVTQNRRVIASDNDTIELQSFVLYSEVEYIDFPFPEMIGYFSDIAFKTVDTLPKTILLGYDKNAEKVIVQDSSVVLYFSYDSKVRGKLSENKEYVDLELDINYLPGYNFAPIKRRLYKNQRYKIIYYCDVQLVRIPVPTEGGSVFLIHDIVPVGEEFANEDKKYRDLYYSF